MARTRIDFPSTRSWPRKSFGLGQGWQGWAWTWLQLRARGLVPDDRRVLDAIARRLRGLEAFADQPHAISHLIGSASYPLVAALAATSDPRFEELFEQSLATWIEICPDQRPSADVMFGSAGALLACAEIDGYLPGRVPARFLRQLQRETRRELVDKLAASDDEVTHLGFSHGVAGYLLALEMAQARFGLPLADRLRDRCLDLLVAEQVYVEGDAHEPDFALWPIVAGHDQITIHGWCNGGPGMALAFLGGYRLTKKRVYRRLARLALAGTASFGGTGGPSLCCGSVGRAHILVEGYRQTGDDEWLERAARMTRRIRFPANKRVNGLLHGKLGLSLLKWRLAHPDDLPMPWLGSLSCVS